jgi:AbrB family looped-hinge helix DNA binding protein
MTIVRMSEKGQIVVPKEARDKRGYGLGSTFAFLEAKDGDLIFRPVNVEPKLSLIEHLKKFKGVEIPARSHHCPPRL